MVSVKSARIPSIDILRGMVMILMALDHVRDYFHLGSFTANDPMDLETTTPTLFFTRAITHFSAPIFVFLAGTSAFLYGAKKTKRALLHFLLTRGLWLMFLEIVLNNFIWWFDISYSFVLLQVIWAIGMSMVLLSFLIYLPKKALLVLGICIVAGHNLLETVSFQGSDMKSVFWYVFFQVKYLQMGSDQVFLFGYPVIPWLGIMVLGYCFGTLYKPDCDPALRRKVLLPLGVAGILLFFLLRSMNGYGDPLPWAVQKTPIYTLLSFFNVAKYPPSLLFTLITLGPALIALSFMERWKGKFSTILLVFGRVPLFYYFLHVLVIHTVALLALELSGGNWRDFILTSEAFSSDRLANFGYPLIGVYLLWLGLIVLLYPLCKWYMAYKAGNRQKWWLKYL